jgi:phenylacetate-coenzyme A ligase PaaK-like adenylate-forming protein
LIPTSDIFSISNQKQFEKIALKVFRFQYENNLVYKEFCDFMKVKVSAVKSLKQIPFLPIQFFKSHSVVSNTNPVQETFTSSGTSGQITSRHCVTDVSIYEESYRKGFAQFYGNIEDYVVFRKHLCMTFEKLSMNLFEFLKINDFNGFDHNLIRRFAI